MFGKDAMKGSDIETGIAALEGIDDATKAAVAKEWNEIALDVGATREDVGEVVAIMRGLEAMPDARTTTKWQAETANALTQEHGSQAGEMLALARSSFSAIAGSRRS